MAKRGHVGEAISKLFSLEIVRYLFVGGLAFIVDFGLMLVFANVFHVWLWLAVAIGYWAGFVVSYLGQKNYAFQSAVKNSDAIVRYCILVAINWGITTGIMYLFTHTFHWGNAWSKIVCTVLMTIWNYFAYRFFVFPPIRKPIIGTPTDRPASIDVIIPAHNSTDCLEQSITELLAWHRDHKLPLNAIIVENNSTDDTYACALAQRDRDDVRAAEDFKITVIQSPGGMGNAYRAGIEASSAEALLLTADDLPFGDSDLNQWYDNPRTGIILGSKHHPESDINRSFMRSLSTWGFTWLRRWILGTYIGDSQGTLFVPGDWARSLTPYLKEETYLSSTEIVSIAEIQRVPLTEIPVRLTERQSEHATRISLMDVVMMGRGLFRLRKRYSYYSKEIPRLPQYQGVGEEGTTSNLSN